MKKNIILILSLTVSLNIFANNLKGNYQLQSSKIDYLVKYLIKKAAGESVGAKGKGECTDTNCDFIVGAPLKSFESKDANRDLNMQKTTKADKFPLVSAKIKTDGNIVNGKLITDLEVEIAGVKKNYSKVPFDFKTIAGGFSVDGGFDLLLDEHKIEKPSLLGVDIEAIVPIHISADWKKI